MTTLAHIPAALAALTCLAIIAHTLVSTTRRSPGQPGWRALQTRPLPQSAPEI